MATSDHYDVIVIGSGPGDGSRTHRPAPAGKRILMLERGGYLPRSRTNWDAKTVFVDGRYTDIQLKANPYGPLVASRCRVRRGGLHLTSARQLRQPPPLPSGGAQMGILEGGAERAFRLDPVIYRHDAVSRPRHFVDAPSLPRPAAGDRLSTSLLRPYERLRIEPLACYPPSELHIGR